MVLPLTSRALARLLALGVLLAATLLWAPALGLAEEAQQQEVNDPRYFPETGYRIANDKFWEYFQRRGGINTFGYPVSREFQFLGAPVQIFQRLIVQLGPDGNPRTMNLLDEGLMPYTRVNGSSYPAPDPALTQRTPSPADVEYGTKIVDFMKGVTQDTWDGLNVRFWKAFNSTVSYEQAFPEGNQPESLLPLINLEIWGAPTSLPSYDPSNHDFVYQRFQRGIAHYRKSCDCTEGVLLGDYFKAILTGENLPPDLAEQARGSRFFGQYAPSAPSAVARPSVLAATNLLNAFAREAPLVTGAQPTATSVPVVPTPTPVVVPTATPVVVPTAAPTAVPTAAPTAVGSAQTGSYVARSPEYGLSVFLWGHPETTARDLGRVADLGFGWQKTLFQWREIEGAGKGRFDWRESDRVIRASSAAGVKVLARLDFQPGWARADGAHNGPPDNYQDFADFVSALVSRYKQGSPIGRLHAIEIWNEVNLARE
ncbi:MAG: hypothetical protein HY690_01665, partial [Chloroflexi bacterium]|nr:hypothetical protein [Chloroflexota bacterium]